MGSVLFLARLDYLQVIIFVLILVYQDIFSQLIAALAERKALLTVYYPWAIRAAASCKDLMSVRYEDRLNHKLIDIRAELNLDPAPDFKWNK